MKKTTLAKILILVLVLTCVVGMIFACEKTPSNPSGSTSGSSGTEVHSKTKAEILEDLSSGLTSAISSVKSTEKGGGTVSVASEYEITMSKYKYEITYSANYDYSSQNGARSSFYLKVFDSEYHMTRLMLYYKADGSLYYETEEGRYTIKNFGQTGAFQALYSFVKYFDMSSMVLDENFASAVVELDTYINAKNLTQYTTSENRENISLEDVNFDARKSVVNNILTSAFTRFSTTYDALSKEYLGIEISRLAEVQLSTLNANKVEFYTKNSVFDETAFDFSGILESNDDYSLKGSIAVYPEKVAIVLDQFDDPDSLEKDVLTYANKNKLSLEKQSEILAEKSFKETSISRKTYDGTLEIDVFGTVYEARLFYDIDIQNDANSKASFRLYEENEVVGGAYYTDSRLYIDLGDFYTTFKEAFSLEKFNLPRVYHTTFNLSDAIKGVYDTFDMVIRGLGDSDGNMSTIFDLLNKKLVSEDSKMTLYIDKQFVETINDMQEKPLEKANVATYIANVLGFDKSVVETYLSSEMFDVLRLVVEYDVHTGSLSFRFENTASESDAYSIESVDDNKSLYDEVGKIDEQTSSVTVDGNKYYFYQYSGELFSTTYRTAAVGTFRGDSKTIRIKTGDAETEYTINTGKYGVASLTLDEIVDGKKTAVEKGKIYTIQGYMVVEGQKYYFTYGRSDGILYKDKARTEEFVTIDFSKYLFRSDDVYYYIGGSEMTYFLKDVGTIDVFTGKVVLERVQYEYRNGVVTRVGETSGAVNQQGHFVIKTADGKSSQSFVKGNVQTENNRTELYLLGDNSQNIVGYYYPDYETIEITSGEFSGKAYGLGEKNTLVRIYGYIDLVKTKEIEISGNSYKVNFGGVYTTQEGIDTIVTLTLAPAKETRDLYSIVGTSGDTSFTLDGKVYYIKENDDKVYTDASYTLVLDNAKYDSTKRVAYIGTSPYKLSLDGNLYYVYGQYEVDDRKVEFSGVTYYVDGSKVYADTDHKVEAGSVDEEKIVIDGQEFYYDEVAIETSRNMYKEFNMVENAGFVVNGEISLSQVNSLDVSKFLGAFIGDAYGVNTPYTLNIGEKLKFVIKTAYKDDELMFYAELNHLSNSVEKVLLKISTASGTKEDLLVDYFVLSEKISFRSTVTDVLTSLRTFAGDGSVFNDQNVTAALYRTLSYSKMSFADNGLEFSISYDTSSGRDSIKDLIGLEYLSVKGVFNVVYDESVLEVDTMNANKDLYEIPSFKVADEIIGDNIYSVQWIKTVNVKFASSTYNIVIPYVESSIRIESGKNIYEPTASIFGKSLTYKVILKDKNGTKGVVGIKDGDIVIDPWAETPLPEKIEVTFADGTSGSLAYEIVGFDKNNIGSYGNAEWDDLLKSATYPTYTVVIGKNSIGETTLENVTVKVVTRIIESPYEQRGQTKVVSSAKIDPYEYESNKNVEYTIASSSNSGKDATNKTERFYITYIDGKPYLKSMITLSFYEYYTTEDHSAIRNEKLYVDWDYDFSKVHYTGDESIAKAISVKDEYGNAYKISDELDIAVKVSVSGKVFEKLYLYDIKNNKAENSGEYTIDSLDKDTYEIPSVSTDEYMVLVYFVDGHFRMVGKREVYDLYVENNLLDLTLCDGIFDETIDWQYKSADFITALGTSTPLAGGRASVNKATVGGQEITLTVKEPARTAKVNSQTVSGVTQVSVNGNVIDRNVSSFSYNIVEWEGIDGFYKVNPYKNEPLPKEITVYFNTASSGEENVQAITYPVERYDTSSGVVIEKDGEYYLRYPTTEKTYFKAELYIGNGNVEIPVVVVIENKDAEYSTYRFAGLEEKQKGESTILTVDAFSPYKLPDSFTITLLDGEEISYNFDADQGFRWFINYGETGEIEIVPYSQDFVKTPSKYMEWSQSDYQSFTDFVLKGEGSFNADWISDKYYMFGNTSGQVTLTAYVSGSAEGALEQKLQLTVDVVEMSSFDISKTLFSEQSSDGTTVTIDSYLDEAGEFYSRIVGEEKTILFDLYSIATGKTYTYYQPVSFTSGLDNLLSALGKSASASESVEATFTTKIGGVEIAKTFVTKDRTISGADNFYFRYLPTLDKSLLDVKYSIETGQKKADITIYKVYDLKTRKTSSQASTYALPKEYFALALSSVFVAFEDHSSSLFATDVEKVLNEIDFDSKVLNFASGDTTITFSLKIGGGSALDYLNVTITTKESTATDYLDRSTAVDIYNKEDGSLKYENGYDLPSSYRVRYSSKDENGATISYVVEYTDLVWKVRLGSDIFVKGEEIRTVPVSAITDDGMVLYLTATLPDGGEVQRNIQFYPKNMTDTGYNGATEDGNEVLQGKITYENSFSLNSALIKDGNYKVFDMSLLPKTVISTETDISKYYEENQINYAVEWNLKDAKGIYYFRILQNGTISSSAKTEEDGKTWYKIADGTVKGYNNKNKTLSLYITFDEKSIEKIEADGYEFAKEGDQHVLYIDPYEIINIDGSDYYIWEKSLPSTLTATLLDGTTYKFENNEFTYTYQGEEIDKVVYDYEKFIVEGTSDTITSMALEIVLTDGKTTVPCTVKLKNKTYVKAMLPYLSTDGTTKYIDDVYYIDPYNADTFTVPTTIKVGTADGEESEIVVKWNVYSDESHLSESSLDITYKGATYYLKASMPAYRYTDGLLKEVDEQSNQYLYVRVVVINRSAKGSEEYLTIKKTFSVENGQDYIAARLIDIVDSDDDRLGKDYFVDLPESLPLDFYIVDPIVTWTASDDDIKDGMDGSTAIKGTIGDNGQEVRAYIVTDKLTLKGFDLTTINTKYISSQGVVTVFINPYTLTSVQSEFTLLFDVETFDGTSFVKKDNTVPLTFYVAPSTDEEKRHTLTFAESMKNAENGNNGEFVIGNSSKLNGISSKGKVYFTYQNLTPEYIRMDLGLGLTDNVDGKAYFVIDPLKPYLPDTYDKVEGFFGIGDISSSATKETVEAEGFTVVGTRYGLWLNLGVVNIDWDTNKNGTKDAFENMPYDGGGNKSKAVTCSITSGEYLIGTVNFGMYYLNRTPSAILTDETAFGVVSVLYAGYNDLNTSSGITINPLNNYKDGSYHLMSKIIYRFTFDYSSTDPEQVLLYKATEFYGSEIVVSGINFSDYNMPSAITVGGTTEAMTISLVGGTVKDENRSYRFSAPSGTYPLKLNVTDVSVVETSITESFEKGSHDLTIKKGIAGEKSEYAIDPYNLVLPNNFTITFGADQVKTIYSYQESYTEIWKFDEDIDKKLNEIEIINNGGTIKAYIEICGEKYYFTFEVTSGKIVVDSEGNTNTVEIGERLYIVGGTIYIFKTDDFDSAYKQLPSYMYYDLSYPSGEYTRVPITWSSDISSQITKEGTFTARARLGGGTEDNIIFDIVVVDTSLLEIKIETDALGNIVAYNVYDLVYDVMIASLTSSGTRVNDIDTLVTPQLIKISDEMYFDIKSVEYDLESMKAVFWATYEFGGDNENTTLAGDKNGNKTFSVSLAVNLVANNIDTFTGEAGLDKREAHFAVGEDIMLSSLPKAVFNGNSYYIFWDLSGELGGEKVDKYKAGSYKIKGRTLNAYREVVTFDLTLVIDKTDISNAVSLSSDAQSYYYTGRRRGDFDKKIAFSRTTKFINTDGQEYMPEFTFEFSSDGENFVSAEPVDVGEYFLKVSIDDENVTGERIFNITIRRKVLESAKIEFADTTLTYTGRALRPRVIYDGEELSEDVGYYFVFSLSSGIAVAENGVINAGTYRATLRFNENPNYDFSSITASTTFVINKKDVEYRLLTEEVYDGTYRHITVDGLPSTYQQEGVEVIYTYTYTDSNGATITTNNKIRDVGTYNVSVQIKGGNNYSDFVGNCNDYKIVKKQLVVYVESIVSIYPETLPLSPTIRYEGIVGTDAGKDLTSLLGTLKLTSTADNYKIPVPGTYEIIASGLYNANYDISYVSGEYIVKLASGVEECTGDLQSAIDNAEGNVKLYLKKGSYGDIVINKAGKTVTLIGEYEKDGTPSTTFNSIVVENGALELISIGFKGIENTVSLTVKSTANGIIVNRCVFYGETISAESTLLNSEAIRIENGFSGSVTIEKTTIKYRTLGIISYSASIVLTDTEISYVKQGIALRGGSLVMTGTTVDHSSDYALYIATKNATFSLVNNTFHENGDAIRYNALIDIENETGLVNGNVYTNNINNFSPQN